MRNADRSFCSGTNASRDARAQASFGFPTATQSDNCSVLKLRAEPAAGPADFATIAAVLAFDIAADQFR
jgi:hypothetical protein